VSEPLTAADLHVFLEDLLRRNIPLDKTYIYVEVGDSYYSDFLTSAAVDYALGRYPGSDDDRHKGHVIYVETPR